MQTFSSDAECSDADCSDADFSGAQSHIIKFFGSSGWEANVTEVEIFMPLMAGCASNLVPWTDKPWIDIMTQLTKQILSALDYLASRKLCHRDVKPQNILFDTPSSGEYNFQLTDFGLVNYETQAQTFCGTPIYMPPELNLDHR